MNDREFRDVLRRSFMKYLMTNARSNEKLKILHGAMARDILHRINRSDISVLSLGIEEDKERVVDGKYNEKKVDITFSKSGTPIAGIAVKFVMSNYQQNSNNYFENMLGETANIRRVGIPYYQIFIIPDIIPYFGTDNALKRSIVKKWETIDAHNISKYVELSNEDVDSYLFAPNKMLIYIAHIEDNPKERDKIFFKSDYFDYYKSNFPFSQSNLSFDFGDTVFYNDYGGFASYVATEISKM